MAHRVSPPQDDGSLRAIAGIDVGGPSRLGGRRQLRRGPFTRLWTRIRGASLDRALAAGVDPGESALLACRAARLTSRRSRRRMAAWVAGTVRAAHECRCGLSAAIAPDREEVLGASEELLRVEELLRSPAPVYARGVALLRILLSDGGGTLYAPGRSGELGDRLESIIAALEGRDSAPH